MEEKIITIASYPYSRAQLLKGRLEAEGIECFLSNLNLVQPDISTGVKVKIHEVDADRVFRIIDEIKDGYGKAKEQTVELLKNVRRILVPIDFSEPSLNACNFALGMAHKLKAEIKLFYTFFNPVVSSEPYLEGYSYQVNLNTVIDNLEKEARLQMKSLKKQLKSYLENEEFANVKISFKLDKGVPEDQIMQYSASYNPGVIVMGTRGRAQGAINLIGSVTKKIIQNATVPVFIIPKQSIFLGINYINKVLYATDFDESDFKTLRKLMNLIRPFSMKIHCVHIATDEENSLDLAKMDSLKAHFQKEFDDYSLTCDIMKHKDVFQGLEDYIDEKDIDMIALTTRKRGLIERLFNPSLARRMLFHTNIPLLVFHS